MPIAIAQCITIPVSLFSLPLFIDITMPFCTKPKRVLIRLIDCFSKDEEKWIKAQHTRRKANICQHWTCVHPILHNKNTWHFSNGYIHSLNKTLYLRRSTGNGSVVRSPIAVAAGVRCFPTARASIQVILFQFDILREHPSQCDAGAACDAAHAAVALLSTQPRHPHIPVLAPARSPAVSSDPVFLHSAIVRDLLPVPRYQHGVIRLAQVAFAPLTAPEHPPRVR
mmetsp:Transcript_7236/g.15734  ORF Transcript_7236/g.15734 Transcript_7236/m.15734 type:complete len:225 (-) Transcript_7236:319-993(-)